jgi:hypothetical protein
MIVALDCRREQVLDSKSATIMFHRQWFDDCVRGRAVASRSARHLRAEESPGSMGRLPGNAWARQRHKRCGDGQCHRKHTADVVE